MSENSNRNSIRASAGKTRLTQTTLERPDTLVILPSGDTITLGRSQDQDRMPLFRKVNPKRIDMRTGKPHGNRSSSGKDTFKSGNSRIPFTKFLLTALLLQQAVSAFRNFWLRWQLRRKQRLGLVPVQPEEEAEEQQDITPDVAQAERRLQEAMLPAMMRAALPKPSSHRTTAAQMAAKHKAQKRHLPSAKQMMGLGQNVRKKQPTMLGKLNKTMQEQVRQVLLAQEQSQQLQLEAAKRMLALHAVPAGGAAGADTGTGSGQAVILEAAQNPVKKR